MTDDTNHDSGSRKASEQDGSRKELPNQMEQSRNLNMDTRQTSGVIGDHKEKMKKAGVQDDSNVEGLSTTKEHKEVSKVS